MADQRISELFELTSSGVASNDELPIVDTSVSQTKKITVSGLVEAGFRTARDGSLPGGKLEASGVTGAKIAAGAVSTVQLAATGVTAAKIADGAVGTTQLAATGVTTAKIADAAVTYAKLQDASANVVLGRTGTSGDVEEISCTVAGRALLDDADAAAQRATLGLGNIALASGTWSDGATVSGTNTGDQFITLSGVITGSGTENISTSFVSGSVSTTALADSGVTTIKIADAAVTYAKLQDANANVVLGRTAASGDVEEISCTAAGRALLDDASAAAQRTTLGLGNIALGSGTWTNGASVSGTNTGDQTITLSGVITGTGTAGIATAFGIGVVNTSALTDNGITTRKIASGTITGEKLANNSSIVVTTDENPPNGEFEGQGLFNTSSLNFQIWNGVNWSDTRDLIDTAIIAASGSPLTFTASTVSSGIATVTQDLILVGSGSFFAGPSSGEDAKPAFRAITASDLPVSQLNSLGVVMPGDGLQVDSFGKIGHTNSVSSGTYAKVTVDAQGHVTQGELSLQDSDIPSLDASKIATGTFGSSFIADSGVTSAKLADNSTCVFGSSRPATGDFAGQLFYDPVNQEMYIWNGQAWFTVQESTGAIIFAGLYNASGNTIVGLSPAGFAMSGATVGSGLPAADSGNSRYYFIVSASGTGTGNAPNTVLIPPDLVISDGTAWYEVDVSSSVAVPTAGLVGFTPAGDIQSITVQAAIEEVSSECRNANNITSGTLPVARGGTGSSSISKGQILVGKDDNTFEKISYPASNGKALISRTSASAGVEWQEVITRNGGILGSSGGNKIFVDSSLGAGLRYTTLAFPNLPLYHIDVLGSTILTANRVITFPDETGDVVTTGASGKVTGTMLATITTADKIAISSIDIDGATAISSSLDNADLFIVDDGANGTNRKITASGVASYVTSVTLASGNIPLSSLNIDGGTPIGSALSSSDLFIVDDGANGTNRSVSASGIASYVYGIDPGRDIFINGVNIGRGGGNDYRNTACGNLALNLNANGVKNTAIGSSAIAIAVSGSSLNTAVGAYALIAMQSNSSRNTAVGADVFPGFTAGSGNTALGYLSGANKTSGDNCTLIGNEASSSTGTVSNEITLGNSNITSLRCAVQDISSLSDARDKDEIVSLPLGLSFIDSLNPVAFTWKTREGMERDGKRDCGFLAQDLLKVQEEHGAAEMLNLVLDNNPDKLEASYGRLMPVVVQALKEASAEIDSLKQEIALLKQSQ